MTTHCNAPVCGCTCKHHNSKVDDILNSSFRLGKNVIPSHYEIRLEPNLSSSTFTGEVSIEVDVLEPTKVISLNAKELDILSASIVHEAGTEMLAEVELNSETQMAHLTFAGQVGKGKWTIKLSFNGTLNDSLKGFYRSSWTDADGVKHPVACTQFESTDARRCFPCFDEPEFKATYKAYLKVDSNLTALSNGRIVSTTQDGDKKVVEFATTMKMSTYLVAFVVGEFESSQSVWVNGKELKIWANPGKSHLMTFSLKAAAHALAWYENYYRVPYPGGDKIDFIAIKDFAAGAMENLGCITFRETSLLVDENTATQGELERVAEVVMHELAHMWFGDLVTMKWWNGLWLNESFATFMENKALAAWRPEWKIWDKFATDRAAASSTDALNSTHAIECEVVRPEDAQEMFDVISYQKGCSTLYQIEQFIGEEVFRDGVSHYLAKHSFKNTETHDLWDSLEQAAKAANVSYSVRKIMDGWVFTAGHPVLFVKSSPIEGFVEISQRPFKFLAPANGEVTWPVPVSLRTVKGDNVKVTKFVLEGKSQQVYVGEDVDYVVVNSGGSGFYRVVYDSSLAAKLSTDVMNKLTVVERFNLVNDTFAAVRAKMIGVHDYLNILKLFCAENDPSVWSVIIGSLSKTRSMADDINADNFAKFVKNLAGPMFADLGYDQRSGDSVHIRQLRGQLMSLLGVTAKDPEVITKAGSMFDSWLADRTAIDPNVVPAVVSILAVNGDEKRYEQFMDLFRSAATPQDAIRFMMSLTNFADPKLLNKTLEACLDGTIRSQDAPLVVGSVLGNKHGRKLAWEFIKSNWDRMVASYPVSGVVRIVGGVANLDSDPSLIEEVEGFFGQHPVESGNMALAQAKEQQLINVAARGHHAKNLIAYFG